MIRFDAERARATTATGTRFSKPYFYTCLVSYALGLIVTVGVMEYFNAAQVRARVRACVRACVRVCVRACVRARVHGGEWGGWCERVCVRYWTHT